MNTRSCLLLAGLFALSVSALGQSVDQLVADGRAFLVSHDITNANTKFAAAVITSPTDPTANTFYAATRLITLSRQPLVGAFLDRLGISSTNRDIYHWRTSVPRDTNGVPLAPANMSVSEASDLLHTNILHTIGAASSNLANVKNANFLLALSQKETLAADVTLDYGDVLLLRSLLEFSQYLGYTITAWNFDTQLAEIRSLITQGALTAQELLQDHPQLFTFATTNDLGLARQSFGNAVTLYLSASDFIRNRPTNVTRLFNYDPAMAVSEADFRTTLVDLNESLKSPVVLTIKTNITMALGNQFDGLHPLRSFLPEFAGNDIIAGTLPDSTFGGIVQGLPSYQVEKFLGSAKTVPHARIPAARFLSQFTVPQRLPGGQIKIGVDALDGAFMVVQASPGSSHLDERCLRNRRTRFPGCLGYFIRQSTLLPGSGRIRRDYCPRHGLGHQRPADSECSSFSGAMGDARRDQPDGQQWDVFPCVFL